MNRPVFQQRHLLAAASAAVVWLHCLAASADAAERVPMKLADFPIEVGDQILKGVLAEPEDGRLAESPAVLLTFAMTCQEALHTPPQDEAAKVFVAAGHRAVSFDLPEHGARIAPGQQGGISGMCAAVLEGKDPFEQFVREGRAAVDACLQRKLAAPGRIFVCGVSRGGYCALRLAAADARIGGVAGLAPVTDWRVVREFAAAKARPEVAALTLDNYVAQLAGRPVYLAIGNQDRRVGTDCCVRLANCLFAEQARQGLEHGSTCLHVVDDSPGHSLNLRWRHDGAEFLLRLAR
jgi:hypothetical protein